MTEAQRLAEEAKHHVDALNAVAQLFTSTRPGAQEEMHEQAAICCDDLKAIIDRLASMKSADQARDEAPEQDPEMLAAMQESNTWHFAEDIVPVLKAAKAGEWQWFANTRCKYIELRIDMRDLGCIIRDREGVRISPATLAYQYCKDAAMSTKEAR